MSCLEFVRRDPYDLVIGHELSSRNGLAKQTPEPDSDAPGKGRFLSVVTPPLKVAGQFHSE